MTEYQAVERHRLIRLLAVTSIAGLIVGFWLGLGLGLLIGDWPG